MKGIRKKIIVGFTILSLLLFLATLVSVFELRRLSTSTQEILKVSSRYTRLAREMLDAAQGQNAALLRMVIHDEHRLDSSFVANRVQFERALGEATITERNRAELDTLYNAYRAYNEIVASYIGADGQNRIDWFAEAYRTSYSDLTRAVENYLSASQKLLESRSEQLRHTAFRVVTPGIITFGVTILLVLVFFSLIDLYFIRPVLQINDSLRNYLANKIPFSVKLEGRDEVYQLREAIDSLIQSIRHSKTK